MSTTRVDGNPATSRAQDAIRILLIIAAAAEPLPPPAATEHPAADRPPDAVAVLESQVRLQKLDFWVRNPDFLADELLNEFERHGDLECYRQAAAILDSDEPHVRRYPMLRFLFGAYESLDDALAVLTSTGLVVRRKRGSSARVHRHDYYLTRSGRDAADRILREEPLFGYFVERTRFVARLADGQRGTHLKDRQYEQEEYRNTMIGEHIGSIAPRVRERLDRYAVVLGVSAS
ncbi:hypothetical protein [Actinoplanes sp. NPDC051494]|uniref:hypothetical protein n=1 Tax=Actinoplanes sp. NPDC051494 TaxID=3363907 RepID=UPI0037BADB15